MRVRFVGLAWNWGVAEFETTCLASLMQPDNLPWLVQNGIGVTLTVYTIERDGAAVRAMLERTLEAAGLTGMLDIDVATAPDAALVNSLEMKRTILVLEFNRAVAEQAAMMLLAADCYFGNGSIRNIATYCRKPGVVAAAIHVRVKRAEFQSLMHQYREKFGSSPISNAKLVDMGLRSQITAFSESNVDNDRNASAETAISLREVAPDLTAVIQHMPSPFMFWPQQSDIYFFQTGAYGKNWDAFDHIWPTQLIMQRRWKILASSDLFFLVELTDEAEQGHLYPTEEGMRYNERFKHAELPHMILNESIVCTLRREPFLS
ncbi:MAG TPA: hypothetical protein VMD07_08020 [Candidatus Acidoferrales bacterium]|nr:hypothetical protein [Candidatus Acidoferrales bacterium]